MSATVRMERDVPVVAEVDVLVAGGGIAGAPMHGGETYVHPGMFFAIGGVDAPKYQDWLKNVQVPEEDVKWARDLGEKFNAWGVGSLKPFYSIYRRAWHVGEYRFLHSFGEAGTAVIDHGFYAPRHGIVGAQIGIRSNRVFSGDQDLMNRLEAGCRVFIFETAQFMRRHVPGFENAYLHIISPYFHTRGGRSACAEYVLTGEDFEKGARFDDVVFRTYGTETPTLVEGGYDFPYRQLIPRGVGGLLMAGKAAIIQPPPNRSRWKCFLMGQCAGVAAALAAKDNLTPAALDVRTLQRVLCRKYHAPMGEEDRLKQMGIA